MSNDQQIKPIESSIGPLQMACRALLKDGSTLHVTGFDDGDCYEVYGHLPIGGQLVMIGDARLDKETETFTMVEVDEAHRRKGVMTALYSFAERYLTSKPIQPSDALEPDGAAFWAARRGKIPSRPMPGELVEVTIPEPRAA